MAPTKRQRAALELEDSEVEDAGSASSNLQQDSRKKARISYTRSSDGDLGASTDEEPDELEVSQFLTQQRNRMTMDNRPADNGIIETVTCTNFMCHAYLEVTLGPLINFIIGHNGSGKSAVLTAITLCLGGKATATNRGQSLKSFIKEGQESSILSVKLKNTESNAYQQEVYGDSIIVERHFSRSGTSSFKLKCSTGRLISNKKADLEEICDYFALQIDNPMNVLTQDMARQFLSNSTPSDKYRFFMKGTQLEQLDGDYLLMEESIETIEAGLETRKKDIKVFEDEAARTRSLVTLSEKHDSLRHKVQRYANQMAWAQVEEQERCLESYDRDIRKADETVVTAEQRAAEVEATFSAADMAFENATRMVQGTKDQLQPLKEEKEQTRQDFDKAKAEAVSLQAEHRIIRDHLKAAEARIAKANADIVNEINKLEEANGGSSTRRLAEIDEKRAEVDSAKMSLEEHDSRLRTLEDEQRQAQREVSDAEGPVKAKRSEVQECEERLNNLMRDRGHQQGAFHQKMPQLINAIRQDEGFEQQPLGPIGTHVRLLKPLWSTILEKSLGSSLTSFVVISKQDQARLSATMQRVGCSFPIIIGNNTSFSLSGHEPNPSFDTTYRVLEIDNDLIGRQLIISQAIEQTLLIKDKNEAVNTLNSVQVHNMKQCFSINAFKAGAGWRIAYGYGDTLSIGYADGFSGPPRMKTDIEYQLSHQRNLLQRLKTELNDLERDFREKQQSLTRRGQAIFRHQKESKELLMAAQRAELTLGDLQDALEEDAIEEGRLDSLKEILKEATEEKVAHEGSYEEAVNAKDKSRESLKVYKDKMTAMDAQIDEGEVGIRKAEAKALKMSNQRQAALREKNSSFQRVQQTKDERTTLQEGRVAKAAQVTDFARLATEVSPRVPVDEGETGTTLDKKLKKLNADLQRYQDKIGGDMRKVVEDAVQAREAYETANDQYRKIEELAQLLKETLVRRRFRWEQFQKHITARARLQFIYLLSERNFRGGLRANHKQKLLDLNVQPDESQRGGGRETKTLSGGEKSFSTICLLLSLWEAMGAPIRCLDEFDVFMDSVNRDVSMKLMIVAARRSIGRQFILITPQSMGNVDVDRDVKIIKLSDPERGQSTISFPRT